MYESRFSCLSVISIDYKSSIHYQKEPLIILSSTTVITEEFADNFTTCLSCYIKKIEPS